MRIARLVRVFPDCVALGGKTETVEMLIYAGAKLEPPGAMVLACDVCRAEIVHTYVRCETCLGAQARASASGAQPPPAFLCCACGEAHASEKSTHNIIVLEKEPHGRLRRTVREFAAFAADAIGTVRSASPCPRDGAWLLPSLFNGEETRLKPVAPRRAPSVGGRGRAAAAGARGAVANRVKPAVSRTLSGSEGMSGALFHKREAARALATVYWYSQLAAVVGA